jgi:hypothetical protein
LARQTAFAKKVCRSQNSDDGFFAVSGNNGKLDLAFLDIEDGVSGIALGENRLILAAGGQGPSCADLGQETLGIEGRPFRFQKATSLGLSINTSDARIRSLL